MRKRHSRSEIQLRSVGANREKSGRSRTFFRPEACRVRIARVALCRVPPAVVSENATPGAYSRRYGIRCKLFLTTFATRKTLTMTGVFYILAFYAAGELLARLTGGWVSGGVIGMILLFAALYSGVLKPDKVRDISRMLLGNMAMFFIPLGVGIVAAYDLLSQNLWSIITAATASTLLVIAVVGYMQQKLGKKL